MNRNRLASNRLVLILALAAVATIVAVLALGGVGDNLVYYWSPAELRAQGENARDATVRLGGQVEAGSVRYRDDGLTLTFRITDGEESVPVVTRSVPPAMFREGIGVVVEGRLAADGRFETDRLMVKHDNQYQAPESGETPSIEALSATLDEAGSPL